MKVHETIQNALDTDEFDRTAEQACIVRLYEAVDRATWEIQSGNMQFDNRRSNVLSVLVNSVA